MCNNKNNTIWLVSFYATDPDGNPSTSLIASFFTKEEAVEFGKQEAYYNPPDEYTHHDYRCDFLISSEIKEPVKTNFYRQSYVVVEEYQIGTRYGGSDMILCC